MVDHCKLGSEWDMNQQITPVRVSMVTITLAMLAYWYRQE